MNMEEPSSCSTWTREEDKVFENALAWHPEESADRWEKIAEAVGGKTVRDIEHHYQLLVEDINGIESGRVPLPSYVSSSDGSAEDAGEGGGAARRGAHSGHSHGDSGHGGKASRLDQERRKGIPWTEDEHRFFLLGLNKYGKGDWRSISRNFVISRTPTQVASHAQKYFIRLNSMNKDRRRSSIHDITTVNPSGELPPPQAPITGQTNSPVVGTGKSVKQSQSPQQQPGPPRVSMYGTTTMGQPVAGHLASAVGTPVSLPAPPHLAYGVRVPVPGAVVPGTPARIAPVTYPMPHASAHG